jgi:uncharacterized protein YndB with AHSA1/START domain
VARTVVSRVIAASPAEVYAALLDPAAVASWKVPDGMSSEVHEWEPRVGGRFRVSLTYDPPPGGGEAARGKTSTHTDTYSGRFVELVPGELVAESIEFETDREDLGGEMTVRTILRPVPGGTEVLVDHDGLPEAVDPADNETGTEMALAKLARLFEAAKPAS